MALKHLVVTTQSPNSHPQPAVRTPLSTALPSPQASTPAPIDLDALATVFVTSLTGSQSPQAAEEARWAQTHLKKQPGT